MRFYLISLLLVLPLFAQAQLPTGDTRQTLENQRKEIVQEITETENQLKTLKSDKKVTLTQLNVLQEQLTERQLLIDNLNDEVKYIDYRIALCNRQIAGLRKKLERFKLQYARSIRYSYRNRTTLDMLAFLCSSNDFNEAIRRMRYLKLMRAMRQQQADKIRETHAAIYHQLDLLNAEKAAKDKLLVDLTGQHELLAGENKEANEAFKDLAGREKELQAELAEKRKSEKRIDNAIQSVIKQEMAHSEEKAERRNTTADDGSYSPDAPAISKAELKLAGSFEKNKGRLAWPVDKGHITCKFGKYSIRNIQYFNNGLDIRTVTYGIVKSVFEGTVSSVVEMDGKVIIIVQHGNYFTVYNNLLRGMVLKGQHVIARQPLGLVAQNEEGFPTLNFQIWKSGGSSGETVMVNPEVWISKSAK